MTLKTAAPKPPHWGMYNYLLFQQLGPEHSRPSAVALEDAVLLQF